ncbi:AAA family ATPase [Halodesulfovibrio aestuarii]|uniref:AAA family ATPase n=1 Tax=Halodesulfovibrio aestuarii TaxID=126333 RepID=UPI003D350E27
MKLRHFEAKNVHEMLNFNITFHDDVNFFVGVNGSGKTTVIKLISGLVNFDFAALIETKFEYLLLTFETNSGLERQISCWQKKDKILVSYDGINKGQPIPIAIDAIMGEYWERTLNAKDRTQIMRHRAINEVTLIGLIRNKAIGLSKPKDETYWIEFGDERENSPVNTAKDLIVEEFRQLRVKERQKDDDLKTQMLSTIFTYTNFDDLEPLREGSETRKKISQLRNDAEEKFTRTGLFDEITLKKMSTFFEKMEVDFEETSKQDPYISLTYLMNKGHLERIAQVIELLDENKKEIEEVYARLNIYIQTVNSFFSDSGKRLEIDKKGDLQFYYKDHKIKNLECLSSGEQQVFVLMTILAFHKSMRNGKVFLIDEPELSLHLFWQHKFVDAIKRLAPTSQFILATHSPEILSGHRDKAISVGRG